jgi:2,4-diaminopentanoate dehydrogenase
MPYRVIHCGTGNVGQYALKAVLRNPEMELVGHYVSSPEKVGKDSAELIGLPPVGITATNDWDALVDLEADCLIYFGNATGREDAAIADLVPFLKRGTNVATFSGYALAHPATTPAAQRAMIEAACAEGNSTCYFTGIDPGWATTDLAIAALACADQVKCVRLCELGFFGGYSAEVAMKQYFGFGQDESFEPIFVKGGFIESMWGPTLHQIAEVLDTPIDEFRLSWSRDTAKEDIETGFGVVRKGTTAVIHFEFCAMSKGEPFIIVEHLDTVTRNFDSKWKRPHRDVDIAYRIEVEGEPGFHLELSWEKDGALLCAMPAINAVPAVCEASAGLKGPLDIERYWSRKRLLR